MKVAMNYKKNIDLEKYKHKSREVLVSMIRASSFYDEQKFFSSEYPKGFSLGTKFNNNFASTPVSIVFPVNKRTYKSNGLINIWNGKDKLDSPYLDIRAIYTKKGNILLPRLAGDNQFLLPLSLIFPRYWSKDCGWDYYIDNSYNALISIPKTKSGWTSLLKALTEFLIFIRVYLGTDTRLYFCKDSDIGFEQKNFSIASTLVSFIPTAVSLAYVYKIFPAVQKQLHFKLTKSSQTYNPQFEQKFRQYIKRNYKDLEIITMGPASCYINPKQVKKEVIEKLIESGFANPDRRRTFYDYIVWGYKNNKHLIILNDLDTPLTLGHELGHYLIEKEKFGKFNKFLQNHQQKGFTNRKFISFVGWCLGLFGPIGEISGIITSFLLHSPLLYTEFLASYRGLEELKKAGISEKDYNDAKEFYTRAWKTYLAGSTYRSVKSPAWGRLIGALPRHIILKSRKQ